MSSRFAPRSTQRTQLPARGSQPSGRPNILLLMVDEQRYPPVYENQAAEDFRKQYLPAQQRLRERGVEFHRHYTASAACAPSRGSFYTGHYPSLHGVTNTTGAAKASDDPGIFWLDPATVPTLGDYFRAGGYRTFWKGKWHISDGDLEVPGTRTTLTSYDAEGNRDPVGEQRYLQADILQGYGFEGWIGPEPHGAAPLNTGDSAANAKGRDEAFADMAVELLQQLERQQDQQDPWLMVVSFVNPHDITTWGELSRLAAASGQQFDYTVQSYVPQLLFDEPGFEPSRREDLSTKPSAQASYRDGYSQYFMPTLSAREYYRLYFQLMQKADTQLGRVCEALAASRFAQDTIVVFTSDHGDLLGSHGGMHQKWHCAYEEVVHVPLIVSLPDGKAGGSELLTSHVDLIPTVLGLAGLDAEALRKQLQIGHAEAQPLVGRDLSGLLRGRTSEAELATPIYFMTDDEPTRGLSQTGLTGQPYTSVIQPCHVETVITWLDGTLWKYSRYFDNPQFWSAPGTPGDSGVQDVVAVEQQPIQTAPGSYTVVYDKTVKVTPVPDEFEMYNLDEDPTELSNLAGKASYASIEAQLSQLLQEQAAAKRLSPWSGTVPGQSSA